MHKPIFYSKWPKICLLVLISFGILLPSLTSAWNWGGDRNWGAAAGLPTEELDVTIQRAVRWVLSLLGLVAVIFIIIAGFWWMTAAGNEEKVNKAKAMIQAAVIGLIVILLAWAITIFVINAVETSTNPVTP